MWEEIATSFLTCDWLWHIACYQLEACYMCADAQTPLSIPFKSIFLMTLSFSALFSDVGKVRFNRGVWAQTIKTGDIHPKAQQAAEERRRREGEWLNWDMTENWNRGVRQRCCRLVEGKLGMSHWESRMESKGECKEKRDGGLELFNYSTRRQQRAGFQETIRVCSPYGDAHFASFITSLNSQSVKHMQGSLSCRCPKGLDELPGDAGWAAGRETATLL